MIELQEDEVDDHDTSTINEVSFAAKFQCCLLSENAKKHSNQPNKQTAKNWQTKQTNKLNCKKHSKPKHAKQHGEPTNQPN